MLKFHPITGRAIVSSDFLIRSETDLVPFLRRMDPAKRDPSVPPKKVWSGKMPNLLYVPNHFPEICLILRAGSGSLKLRGLEFFHDRLNIIRGCRIAIAAHMTGDGLGFAAGNNSFELLE